jgi:hypothetical protein
MTVRGWATLMLLAVGLAACGGRGAERPPEIAHETPEDEILRVGTVWQSMQQSRGIRPPPNAIDRFQRTVTSTLRLKRGEATAEEHISVSEKLTMRSGEHYDCTAESAFHVRIRYARHHGDAAIEVARPPALLSRRCRPAGFPEPELEAGSGAARFVLRSDQLVAYEPVGDDRSYLPIE